MYVGERDEGVVWARFGGAANYLSRHLAGEGGSFSNAFTHSPTPLPRCTEWVYLLPRVAARLIKGDNP